MRTHPLYSSLSFSNHFCIFMWTGKYDLQRLHVDVDFFKFGEDISFLKNIRMDRALKEENIDNRSQFIIIIIVIQIRFLKHEQTTPSTCSNLITHNETYISRCVL